LAGGSDLSLIADVSLEVLVNDGPLVLTIVNSLLHSSDVVGAEEVVGVSVDVHDGVILGVELSGNGAPTRSGLRGEDGGFHATVLDRLHSGFRDGYVHGFFGGVVHLNSFLGSPIHGD